MAVQPLLQIVSSEKKEERRKARALRKEQERLAALQRKLENEREGTTQTPHIE